MFPGTMVNKSYTKSSTRTNIKVDFKIDGTIFFVYLQTSLCHKIIASGFLIVQIKLF